MMILRSLWYCLVMILYLAAELMLEMACMGVLDDEQPGQWKMFPLVI